MQQIQTLKRQAQHRRDRDATGSACIAEFTPEHVRWAEPSELTLLETALPVRELSLLAKADRRSIDPVYATHRWWARRPPGVIRGLLLASALPASENHDLFWKLFSSAEPHLTGLRIHDMFAGGGAMLVEAARLGATPSGTDVDPLAVKIISHELEPPPAAELAKAGTELLEAVAEKVGPLFGGQRAGWRSVHFFYLHDVTCPECKESSCLYRNLVIARHASRSGGVLRDIKVVAFCPSCFNVHGLTRLDRKELRCCGKRHPLRSGSLVKGKFQCPKCLHRSSHKELQTATAPSRLLAIEETHHEQRRRIRVPRPSDLKNLVNADAYLKTHRAELSIPSSKLETARVDSRPLSYGIEHPRDFFTSRQLAAFGTAFKWVDDCHYGAAIKRALTLALSNALTTNNRLCSYATDYGRLAPLFSVRSYSLPWLSVELNPFHPGAGRGTLPRNMQRIQKSTSNKARRSVWDTKTGKPIARLLTFPHCGDASGVRCASAAEALPLAPESIDICLFDPPYFDYIAYSELSEFYRVWHAESELSGEPLLAKRGEEAASFGHQLGTCLESILKALKSGRPIAFTFHSSSQAAWEAIGVALDKSDLSITSMWPMLNDLHMGHHGKDGNCEWDVVVVCRRQTECLPASVPYSIASWTKLARPLAIAEPDRRCMGIALQMAKARFAKPLAGRKKIQ
jgi:adenine-specific DNA methylase